MSVETALAAAAAAARPARHASPADRASWLRSLADALDAAADVLIPIALDETHLPEARLRGELTRTSFQARLFASELEDGTLFDVRVDHADPDWGMGPRPDIRRTYVPIGPVLVFAASNFPFAFSVAGGDTVSALAAGCPVVVKAHPGHLSLSRATADIVRATLPDGMFGLIEGDDAGVAAVQDPRIKAVGFTGSTHGGRALFDLAVRRPDPIPFYGELGSTNPVVVTPSGWATRSSEIVEGFAGSVTMGSGQFCTKPGVVLLPSVDEFLATLELPAVGPMLNDRIASGFSAALADVTAKATVARTGTGDPAPAILRTTAKEAVADPSLVTTEMFGPAAILVEYGDLDDVEAVLGVLDGSLTGTVQGPAEVDADGARVLDLLSERVGRVIWNGWPTGVTVSDAQQHGGPWPATTAPTTTSVGTAAAQRFARPVAYQGVPAAGLPPELHD